MAPAGSPDDNPVTLAPLTGQSAKSRRTGYLALVASGFITATAFAGIADLASSSVPLAVTQPTPVQEYERNNPGGGLGSSLVPGQAYPEHGEIPVSGAAVAETIAPTTPNDPTIVVITHPDGTRTTTVVPPPPPGTTGNSTTPPPPGSSTTTPPGSSTPPPGSSTTTPPPTTTEPTTTTPEPTPTTEPSPEPTTTEPSPEPTGTSQEETTTSDPNSGGDGSTAP